MSFHSSHTPSNPAGSCSRRVWMQSTSDALVALGNFIAIEVKCSFGNKFSSRDKARDVLETVPAKLLQRFRFLKPRSILAQPEGKTLRLYLSARLLAATVRKRAV